MVSVRRKPLLLLVTGARSTLHTTSMETLVQIRGLTL
jgi:hypothetical protein